MDESRSAATPTARFVGLFLLPPFVVGCALRLVGLRAQVLVDDELHTVGAVLRRTPGEILRSWTHDGADYCVPLSALFRFLIDHGVVVSEMGFRAPSLIAGVVALIAMPVLLSPRIGNRASAIFAWALALSPMLVLYSRIVRPYMLVTLLAFLAIYCFGLWLRSRRRGAAIAYLVLASLATWLHLGAGPLVLAPFVYAGFVTLRQRGGNAAAWKQLALLALATAAAIALPLLPALESLVELVGTRRDGQLPPLATWLEVVALQAGSSSVLLGGLALAGLGRGAWVLRRRDPESFGLIGCVAAVHLLALLVLAPDRMQEATVLSRYLLFLLPFGLALLAVALDDGWLQMRGTPARLVYSGAVAGLALLFVVTGPLGGPLYRNGAFTHSPGFLRLTQPPDWIPGERVPAFYHELYGAEGEPVIVEHPWMSQSSHVFAAYQGVHGRRVLVSSLADIHHDPRVDLQNLLAPLPEEFVASEARFVVVHFDLRREAAHVVSPDPHFATWLRARGPLWEPLRRSGGNMAARLERRWGEPFYRDEQIAVWDLDAVRAERARAEK